ncbi:unnamed protein product [Mytilus edulis]|uniref:SAM domain-containing protein n=1 Tax=Mytilus edulis TaxID=6550 RepID=A0A8S3VGZ5_MYTED|nr:unnamed protein product [Mytilus edulis]
MATSIINFDDFFIVYDLQSIKEVFLENEFSTVLALTDVSDEDLQEMGIKALGKRRQFSAAIKDLKAKWSQDDKSMDEDKGQNSSLLNAVGMNDADKIEKISKSKPRHEPASKRKLYMNLKSIQPEEDDLSSQSKKSKELASNKVNGLRRQKMEFINKKLRQLIEDPIVRSKNKTTIMGIAEVAWDVYNAEEARIDQIQVKSLITALNNMGHHYNEKQTKTIQKDTERVNRASSDISVQLKRITEIKETMDMVDEEKRKRIKEAEDSLSQMHHELQKATDALRKACGVKILQLQHILREMKHQDEEECISDDASDTSIIEEIKGTSDKTDDEDDEELENPNLG